MVWAYFKDFDWPDLRGSPLSCVWTSYRKGFGRECQAIAPGKPNSREFSCGIWCSLCFVSSGGALLLYQSSCRHGHLGPLDKLALITTREVDTESIENGVIPYHPQLIIVLRDLPSCACRDSKYGPLRSRGSSWHSRATETAAPPELEIADHSGPYGELTCHLRESLRSVQFPEFRQHCKGSFIRGCNTSRSFEAAAPGKRVTSCKNLQIGIVWVHICKVIL
jgi:hypothetical protein